MQAVNFDEILAKIVERDPRYARDAYLFIVREALEYTHRMVSKGSKGAPRHVTGQQLLEGIRACALEQYGPLAMMVLDEWGVRNCEDFGEIVFNLVDSGLLGKTEQDSRADFRGGYDFHDAFRKPFQPASKSQTPHKEAKPSKV